MLSINHKTRRDFLIGFIVLLSFCTYFYFRQQSLKENAALADSLITDIYTIGRSGWVIEYEYEIKGLKYKERSYEYENSFLKRNRDNLINRHFPIVYNLKKPYNSEILITPVFFKKYNISYPDSLEWILKLQK